MDKLVKRVIHNNEGVLGSTVHAMRKQGIFSIQLRVYTAQRGIPKYGVYFPLLVHIYTYLHNRYHRNHFGKCILPFRVCIHR